MSITKMVNGIEVPLSDADIAQREADAANLADKMAEKEKVAHIAKRIEEYGSVAEQLDMIYEDMLDGTDKWVKHITKIKEKYPKWKDKP